MQNRKWSKEPPGLGVGSGIQACFLPDGVLTLIAQSLVTMVSSIQDGMGIQEDRKQRPQQSSIVPEVLATAGLLPVLPLVCSTWGGKREFKMHECCAVVLQPSREMYVCTRVSIHTSLEDSLRL